MNKKPLVIALILSLVVSYFLYKKLQTTQRKDDIGVLPPPKIETKPLVVAKKLIPARTRLEANQLNELFEIKEINASDAIHFPDAFTSIASLANRYTAVTVLKGDIMTNQRLLREDVIPDLAHAIPPGKRAVSIAVSKVTGVGGFIQQGNYVDVIATFRSKNGELLSKIVLQDILVLAVGGMYQFDGSVASTPPAIAANKVDLVTLAVTPDELERLMYLESGVTFRLVLKNPQDKDKKIQTSGASEKTVLKGIGIEEPIEIVQATTLQRPSSEQPQAQSNQPPSTITPSTSISITNRDDGRVEIWYGSSDHKKEIYRETYPLFTTATTTTAMAKQQPPTSLPSPVQPSGPDFDNPSGE